MVCINSEFGRRKWMMWDGCVGEVEEYEYLGITVEGGKHGGFKRMGDRRKDANGLIGIVKYAACRTIRVQICDWKVRMEDSNC